jgi:hypothetical protein
MGKRLSLVGLITCGSLHTSAALAQSAPATSVSQPADYTIAERSVSRVRFGISAGLGWYLSGSVYAGGPGITLELGSQLNDRWAVYGHASVHSVVFVGQWQAAAMAEWSATDSTLTLGFGAGFSHAFMLGGPPVAGYVSPDEFSLVLPLELGVNAHGRSSTDVTRSGFRFALQLAPTVAFYVHGNHGSIPLGALLALQFGWATR